MSTIDRNATLYLPGAAGRLHSVPKVHRNREYERRTDRVTPTFEISTSQDPRTQAELAAKLTRMGDLAHAVSADAHAELTLGAENVGELQIVYLRLPAHYVGADGIAATPRWRVELHSLVPNTTPIGLDIVGDVVLGRGSGADLDLEPYCAFEHAVSRRHAILRPTDNHLYLIDMSSTNGTLYNSVPLGRCATHALVDGDVVTLGILSFMIRVVEKPGDRREPVDRPEVA